MFALQLSRTAQKALDKLPPNATKKVFTHLEEIKRDPYRPRPLADIVPVGGSDTHRRSGGVGVAETPVFRPERSVPHP